MIRRPHESSGGRDDEERVSRQAAVLSRARERRRAEGRVRHARDQWLETATAVYLKIEAKAAAQRALTAACGELTAVCGRSLRTWTGSVEWS